MQGTIENVSQEIMRRVVAKDISPDELTDYLNEFLNKCGMDERIHFQGKDQFVLITHDL